MADAPAGLSLTRNRDLAGREREPWTRRGILALIALVLVLGLANVFGQRPSTRAAQADAARLSVQAPGSVRGGLYFQARLTVDAESELRRAAIVLDRGWLDGITINTIEPAPIGEASRDGRLVLELGRVPAGQSHVLFVQMQVNPTTVGRRSADVVLEDGGRVLARVERALTIWP